MSETIAALLAQQAQAMPDKIFLYFGAQEVSYRELDEITNRVAAGLRALGMAKNDKLCVMLPNCPEYVYLFLGAPKLGVTIVPINTALKLDEIAYIADNSDARAIVVSPNFLPLAESIKTASDKVKEIIVVTGEGKDEGAGRGLRTFAQLLEEASEPIDEAR